MLFLCERVRGGGECGKIYQASQFLYKTLVDFSSSHNHSQHHFHFAHRKQSEQQQSGSTEHRFSQRGARRSCFSCTTIRPVVSQGLEACHPFPKLIFELLLTISEWEKFGVGKELGRRSSESAKCEICALLSF